MKLRKFIPRLILNIIFILFVLPTSTTALYDALYERVPENWVGGAVACLGLPLFALSLVDIFRIILQVQRDPYPRFVEAVDPLNGSYRQIIPTSAYVSALKCAAVERHQFLSDQPTDSLKERAETFYEKVKNIITTTGEIKYLRDDTAVTVTDDAVGGLGALKVSRYLQLSRTNLLPLRMSSFYLSLTDEPTRNLVITADSPELSEAYKRFKIPHSVYFGFEEHAPGDIPFWLRWMLPNPRPFSRLNPPVTMHRAQESRTDGETPNLSAYPQTSWQETAAYALALAAHAAKWGTSRAVIIDLLDAYTARQNFIIADKVLTSEQIYAWARSELFSGNDAEFTPNPPAVPEIMRSIIPGELVMPGA